MKFSIYAFYNRNGTPICCGLKIGDKYVYYDLFRQGNKRPIYDINADLEKIRQIVITASAKNIQIITSDFQAILNGFKLPLYNSQYNAYDMHLYSYGLPLASVSNEEDIKIIKLVLDKLESLKIQDYQKVLANAVVVYQSLTTNGVLINYSPVFPQWSVHTWSGRSKTTGFSIQGATADDNIRSADSAENDILLHFDWVSADMRVASIMSNDEKLAQAFDASDPYSVIIGHLQGFVKEEVSRLEAKNYMLRCINSKNHEAIMPLYPKLGIWIKNLNEELENVGYLRSILGRKFHRKYARNDKSVANAVMQGSVAHAMQATVRRLWEVLGRKLVAEIHDSLAVSCRNSTNEIRSTINIVTKIMLNPFEGLLPDNPIFPVRVSMGRSWKKWRVLETHRKNEVDKVYEKIEPETTSAQSEEIEDESDEETVEAAETQTETITI